MFGVQHDIPIEHLRVDDPSYVGTSVRRLCATQERSPAVTIDASSLGELEWRPNRARRELNVLAVVASPSNLARSSPGGKALDPIDIDAELRRIAEAIPTDKPEMLINE